MGKAGKKKCINDECARDTCRRRRPAAHALTAFLAACLLLASGTLPLRPLTAQASGNAADTSNTPPAPDPGRQGSITVELAYDGQPVTGGTLEAYRAGEIVSEMRTADAGTGRTVYRFKKTAPFAGFSGELDNVQSADLARQLAEYVQKVEAEEKEKTVADETGTTGGDNSCTPFDGYRYSRENVSGKVVFDSLPAGLYLIIQSSPAEGYEAINPFLVSVPMWEDGKYEYDVEASSKFSLRRRQPDPEPDPDPDPDPDPEPDPEPDPKPDPDPDPEPNPEPQPQPQAEPEPGVLQETPRTGEPAPETPVAELKLPQTGQLNWPVPVTAVGGTVLLLSGMLLKSYGKKKGNLCAAVGGMTLATCLILLAYNGQEAFQAGKASDAALAAVKSAIEETDRNGGASGEKSAGAESGKEAESGAGRTISFETGGYEYIGYVDIPALRTQLPVMAEWDYPRLKMAPCLYYGSAQTEDMVIAAHNYPRHFGGLSELKEGDGVVFTDMEGRQWSYEVAAVDVLAPEAVAEMTDGEYELTLFTCTYGGANRVTVRCRTSQE